MLERSADMEIFFFFSHSCTECFLNSGDRELAHSSKELLSELSSTTDSSSRDRQCSNNFYRHVSLIQNSKKKINK